MTSLPRITFLNRDLPYGGSSIVVLRLGYALKSLGYPVCVVNMSHDLSMQKEFSEAGLEVLGPEKYDILFEDRVSRAWSHISRLQPDIVIACVIFECCEVLRYLPETLQRIGVVHLDLAALFQICKIYSPWMDDLVGVSEPVRSHLSDFLNFTSPPSIHAIPLGVQKPSQVPARLCENRPLRLIYTGRLEAEEKQTQLFSLIYNGLKARGIPFDWTLVGDGRLRQSLEQAMPDGEKHHIHFTGILPPSEVERQLLNSDIFILTSKSESFGLSLHEAMACGVVPISGDIGGQISHTVNPGSGFLVEPGNTEAYVDCIEKLHKDRGLLNRMSELAVQRIGPEYSFEHTINRWVRLIEEKHPSMGKTEWPKSPPIRYPLLTTKRWHFHPLLRPFRRLAAMLK